MADLTKKHEPFVRVAKRTQVSTKKGVLLQISAFVLAIIAGGLFILLLGENPLEAYKHIIEGAFVGSVRNPLSSVQATVVRFIPLLIASLALVPAFKMKFWNIGAEGQIIMGGVFSTYFALFHSDWPHAILLIVMILAGALGGALWALIPTIFKIKFNTNETLFTLMLNYIALYIVRYLEAGPWQRTKGYASIGSIDDNARLPEVFGVHIGWIIALVLMVLMFFYISKTKQGYEISVVGESQPTARYAGMSVGKIVLRTMIISGAIAGLAGALQVAGIDHTLSGGIAGGVGFTAIVVAWLGKLNPFYIAGISFLFSILAKGSSTMQTQLGLSASVADVVQGIILFCVIAFEFFINYKLIFKKKEG